MRGAGGVGLVAVGLILLWLAITGRLQCVSQFVSCVFGTGGATPLVSPTSNSGGSSGNQLQNTLNNINGIIDFSKGIFGNATPQPTPGIGTQGTTL